MNCLKWYECSAHLVNCAFGQTRCAAYQFINCAAFDELRNIGQSCSALAIGLGLRLRLGLGSGLGLVLELGLVLRNLPIAQRVWSNAQIDQMARLTWLGFCFQISRNMLKFWVMLVCMVILTFLETNLFTAGSRMVWLPCDGEGMQLSFCLKTFSCLAYTASATFSIRLTIDIAHVCKQRPSTKWGVRCCTSLEISERMKGLFGLYYA